MKNRMVKTFSVILFLLTAVFLVVVVSDQSEAENNNQKEENPTEFSNQKEGDTVGLIIPTREEILKNGYPKNENGQTYGPVLKEINTNPDLELAIGENDVQGYVDLPDGISSPSELANYIPPTSTPIYLQDGKTVIGIFYFGR